MSFRVNIKFDDKGKKLTEKSLVDFERRHAITLPDDYRSFLKTANGGTPEDDQSFAFIEDGDETESVLSEFYTLAKSSDDLCTLDDAVEAYVKQNRMPSWFLPVADDAFGNQICLSLSETDFGSVYFWNHEQEPEPTGENVAFANVSLIANSFREFLERLEQVPD